MNIQATKEQLKKEFANKKILIWGYGREGKSTHKFLESLGLSLEISVADAHENTDNIPITWLFSSGWNDSFADYDIIFKSPGIPTQSLSIDKSKFTSQTELFLKYYGKQTVGVTGTKGKSTTSSLLYHVLSKSFDSVFLVGNIGVPCLDYFFEMTPDSIAVFELSAHQLEIMPFSPHIAVFLNFFQEHLDHYGSLENYFNAKANIFNNQSDDDFLVVNSAVMPRVSAKSTVYTISVDKEKSPDIFVDTTNNNISYSSGDVTVNKDDTQLIGKHNLYNIGVCYFIANQLYNVSNNAFLSALRTFKGLHHRLEYIGEKGNIKYYNDSISTTVESVLQAINSIDNISTILVGGLDRGIDYTQLINHFKTDTSMNLVLMYESGHRILSSLENRPNTRYFPHLEEAVAFAMEVSPKGTVCLLSPGAASYGAFANFEERGKRFKELVFG